MIGNTHAEGSLSQYNNQSQLYALERVATKCEGGKKTCLTSARTLRVKAAARKVNKETYDTKKKKKKRELRGRPLLLETLRCNLVYNCNANAQTQKLLASYNNTS